MVTTITTTVTTTTTTTTTTTAVAGQIGAVTGIIAVITLIILLAAKELLSSVGGEEPSVVETSGWVGKARFLAEKINISIYPLLFVFGAIVCTHVLTILR